MTPANLTPKQLELITFLQNYIDENGFSPSYDEMVDGTSAASKSVVAYYLQSLEHCGWIGRTPRVSRSIQVLRPVPGKKPAGPTGRRKIPLLGRISAGTPIEVPDPDHREFVDSESVDVDASLLPRKYVGRDLYALKVQGNSMIDAGVLNGDLIVVEPVTQVDNGDMAVVWFPEQGETTLKYFYRYGDRVRLVPANAELTEKEYAARYVQVQGRLVMTMRVY